MSRLTKCTENAIAELAIAQEHMLIARDAMNSVREHARQAAETYHVKEEAYQKALKVVLGLLLKDRIGDN